MVNNLELAFNNMYSEKLQLGLRRNTSPPIGRTLRELKEKQIVAVVPIFYIKNRYAVLTGKLSKTTQSGRLNPDRYEEEWIMYADCIGRHQDKDKWETQLQEVFPDISMAFCRALACRLEGEILNCELYSYNSVLPSSSKCISELKRAEDAFRERMIPKGWCYQVNWNYVTAFSIIIAVFCHYMILFEWSFIDQIAMWWTLLGASTIVISGLVQLWIHLRVQRNADVSLKEDFTAAMLRTVSTEGSSFNYMTQFSSIAFWFETGLYIVGLSIVPVLFRQRSRAQQRDDWWAEGRGEIFEFSRCVAVYTFIQFFSILCLAVYILEVKENWRGACVVYFIVLLYVTVRNYSGMFEVFFQTIFKYDYYAYCLIVVDRVTDAAIRIWSLSIIISELNAVGDNWSTVYILLVVYLFELIYVIWAYWLAKSEWQRNPDQECGFRGKIRYIFPQVILLMQTSIAYYIPISGFPPKYPRFEAVLRHFASLGFVIWYMLITSDPQQIRRRKLMIIIGFLAAHYISAALFELHYKSFINVQETIIMKEMRNNWSAVSQAKEGITKPRQSIFHNAVRGRTDNLQLTPVMPKIIAAGQPLLSRLKGYESADSVGN